MRDEGLSCEDHVDVATKPKAKAARSHRPRLGPHVARGLRLIADKVAANIRHGHVPFGWSAKDREDAKRAVGYLRELEAWHAEVPDKRLQNTIPEEHRGRKRRPV